MDVQRRILSKVARVHRISVNSLTRRLPHSLSREQVMVALEVMVARGTLLMWESRGTMWVSRVGAEPLRFPVDRLQTRQALATQEARPYFLSQWRMQPGSSIDAF